MGVDETQRDTSRRRGGSESEALAGYLPMRAGFPTGGWGGTLGPLGALAQPRSPPQHPLSVDVVYVAQHPSPTHPSLAPAPPSSSCALLPPPFELQTRSPRRPLHRDSFRRCSVGETEFSPALGFNVGRRASPSPGPSPSGVPARSSISVPASSIPRRPSRSFAWTSSNASPRDPDHPPNSPSSRRFRTTACSVSWGQGSRFGSSGRNGVVPSRWAPSAHLWLGTWP
jgi:hypothetical protein